MNKIFINGNNTSTINNKKNKRRDSNDVLIQLQKTVESLRSKSRNIMRRHSELHDCIQKFTLGPLDKRYDHHNNNQYLSVDNNINNNNNNNNNIKISNNNNNKRKDSFEPTTHYAQLSSEDKQTMKDILVLQEWLLMVKREKSFDTFRSTIIDLKERIFKPSQAKQMRARVASSQALGPPTLNFNKNEADDLDTDEFASAIEEQADKQAEEQDDDDNNDPKIPEGVEFKNGRWIQVTGEIDETVDELDALSDLSDEDNNMNNDNNSDEFEEDWDFDEEQPKSKEHADANALDDLDVPDDFKQQDPTPIGKKTIDKNTRPRSKAFSAKTMPASKRNRAKSSPSTHSKTIGHSKIILHEFTISDKAKSIWKKAEEIHTQEFVPSLSQVPKNVYNATNALNDHVKHGWTHHQADIFSAFDVFTQYLKS